MLIDCVEKIVKIEQNRENRHDTVIGKINFACSHCLKLCVIDSANFQKILFYLCIRGKLRERELHEKTSPDMQDDSFFLQNYTQSEERQSSAHKKKQRRFIVFFIPFFSSIFYHSHFSRNIFSVCFEEEEEEKTFLNGSHESEREDMTEM